MLAQVPSLYRFLSFGGIFVFVLLAWLLSNNRRAVNWRTVGYGIALQFVFGLIVLHPAMQEFFFTAVNGAVNRLLSFSEEGATFVFGSMEAHLVTTVDLSTGEQTEKTVIGQVSPALKNLAFCLCLVIFFLNFLARCPVYGFSNFVRFGANFVIDMFHVIFYQSVMFWV